MRRRIRKLILERDYLMVGRQFKHGINMCVYYIYIRLDKLLQIF